MNGDDDTRLEDWFLRMILMNSQELEEIVESRIDGFLKIEQDTSETLIARGTVNDGENNIEIYINIGRREEAFVRKIQDLIARAGEGEDNYIICIAKEFDNADVEELMQDVVFYLEKNIKLIFLKVDINIEESEEMNFKDIIKEEIGIKVYRKEHY
ncbi:hypothetical protein ONV75_16460 [Clostridium sp. LQ25]|uniref:hypothetical protein n=1 Tax=Clostridium sp. LQ25 TaxID=2992805 RepID=UPI00225325AA|nr:hypothetical protein [Clostridium sp. LQ25]UZT06173.1 hypothetical protein ONV75_16460 [Clostridium sp. LQ25]